MNIALHSHNLRNRPQLPRFEPRFRNGVWQLFDRVEFKPVASAPYVDMLPAPAGTNNRRVH